VGGVVSHSHAVSLAVGGVVAVVVGRGDERGGVVAVLAARRRVVRVRPGANLGERRERRRPGRRLQGHLGRREALVALEAHVHRLSGRVRRREPGHRRRHRVHVGAAGLGGRAVVPGGVGRGVERRVVGSLRAAVERRRVGVRSRPGHREVAEREPARRRVRDGDGDGVEFLRRLEGDRDVLSVRVRHCVVRDAGRRRVDRERRVARVAAGVRTAVVRGHANADVAGIHGWHIPVVAPAVCNSRGPVHLVPGVTVVRRVFEDDAVRRDGDVVGRRPGDGDRLAAAEQLPAVRRVEGHVGRGLVDQYRRRLARRAVRPAVAGVL